MTRVGIADAIYHVNRKVFAKTSAELKSGDEGIGS